MLFVLQYGSGSSSVRFPTGHARGYLKNRSTWTFLPLTHLGSLEVILRTNGLPALLLASLQISL